MNITSVNTVLTHETICEVCGNNFTPKTKKVTIYCSIKCRQAGSNEKIRLQNQEKFLLEHGNDPDMPICKECGWKAFDLITHITKFHKMPMKEYYSKHNCGVESVFHPEQIKDRQERIVGEKNPGYQHGGKFSSVSKNFIHYADKTEEEKEAAIRVIINKQASAREEHCGYTTRISYWTTRGYTREEAILQVQQRQTTFSKEKCISLYGEEKGLETWMKRQQTWLDTLYSNLTEEEYQDLTQRKIQSFINGWSKIATSLFEQLQHPDAIYANESNHTEASIILEDGTEFSYPVDYMLGDKVIEFYGDKIHANPRYFKATDQTKGIVTYTAQYVWDRDKNKQDIIKEAGYQLLIVWEHDYKWNREETIQRCRDFLGLK